MRPIKFRAWDGFNAAMYQSGDTYSSLSNLFELLQRCETGGNSIHLMQFTGLHDKNGTEIYEGDILRSESWGINSRIKNPYHLVVWGKIGWKARGYNGQMEVNPYLDVRSDFEVIGNVHENPELLTDKTEAI